MIGETTAIMLITIGVIGFLSSPAFGIQITRMAGTAVALIGILMMLGGAMIIDGLDRKALCGAIHDAQSLDESD